MIDSILSTFFKNFPKALKYYEASLSRYFSLFPKKGMKVTDNEWEYLIILDACRFDYFKRYNFLKGKLQPAYSLGSHTIEWRNSNFTKTYEDIIYISAAPFISSKNFKGFDGSKHFFKVFDVWQYGWDSELNSVHPMTINKEVTRIKRKYSDKRFIIHYIQPHYPFIGSKGTFQLSMTAGKKQVEGDLAGHRANRYRKLMLDQENLSRIKKAYAENLVFVLKHVQELLFQLDGKTIITADHGEAFGEWGVFAHPAGVHIEPLIKVPWFTAQNCGDG